MPVNTLDKYGFTDDYTILKCRKCDARIPKVGLHVFFKNNPELKTTVVYGWCRKYTHGVSVRKAML